MLVPGCEVYLEVSDNPFRKTKYDLIVVEKVLTNGKSLLINMDSQVPKIVGAFLVVVGLVISVIKI